MEQPREMNLFELCAAFGRAIVRGVKGLFAGIGSWIRLSLRKWWVVLPIMALVIAPSPTSPARSWISMAQPKMCCKVSLVLLEK